MNSYIIDIMNKKNLNFDKLIYKEKDLKKYNININNKSTLFSDNNTIIKSVKIKNINKILSYIKDEHFIIYDDSIAELINNLIIQDYNKNNISHFVNIKDIWFHSNNIYIEMDFIKYSFHNIIKNYQQKIYHEPIYLLSIFFQIIFMIYQMQKINFVHYDLKRENIRFQYTGDNTLSYKYESYNFNVPNFGYTAKCYDFGSSLFKLNDLIVTNESIYNNIYNINYNITARIDLNYDVHFFFQDFANTYGEYFPWIYKFIKDIGIKLKEYDIRFYSDKTNLLSINDIIMSKWFLPFRTYNPDYNELNLQLLSLQFDSNLDNINLPSNTPDHQN